MNLINLFLIFIKKIGLIFFKIILKLLRFDDYSTRRFKEQKADNIKLFENLAFFQKNTVKLFKGSNKDTSLKLLLRTLYRRSDVVSLELLLSKTMNVIKNNRDSHLLNNFQKSFENRAIFGTTQQTFDIFSNKKNMEPVFLHNRSADRFLGADAKLHLNFEALENFKTYLSLLEVTSPDKPKISFKPNRELTRKEKIFRREDSFKTNKRFKKKKARLYNESALVSKETSRISASSIQKTRNTLAQVNFLLKNKRSILKSELRVDNLNLSREVKAVLFSYSNPVGPYGFDTKIYSSDLFSRNLLTSIRRINLVDENSKISDINILRDKVGFFNFNVDSNEESSNDVDVPLGGGFTGYSFSVNPFLIFGFVFYSFLEFFVLLYVMSFFFGTPYDTLLFFFKYPLVYYYENLSSFPSPNYFFFFALILVYYLYYIFF